MIFFALILFLYAGFITHLAFGISKLVKPQSLSFVEPETTFTIVVPFRNEAENLPLLLQSFQELNYPAHLFEVILVDDESNDGWKLEAGSWNFEVKVIENVRKSKAAKKDAIETAIKIAKNQWIVTTDADCQVPENWLPIFDAEIQTNQPKMCVAAVVYKNETGFLSQFQNSDFLSLQGVTAASFANQQPFMCNGANFAYQKDFFYTLNGFEGNNNMASGDDVFLLQKALLTHKDKVVYLGNKNMVLTQSCATWQALFNQRIRWASKTNAYKTYYPKILALLVLLCNFCFVLLLFASVFDFRFFVIFGYFYIVKFGVDFMFLKFSASYFNHGFKGYFLSFLMYPFFTLWVGLKAAFGKFDWKDRRCK